MIEEFHKYYHFINECINKTNDTLDIVKWLVNQGLFEEVANRLLIMIEEGIISDSIFKNPLFIKTIENKITEFKNDGTFDYLIDQQLTETYKLIDYKMNMIMESIHQTMEDVKVKVDELSTYSEDINNIKNKNNE